MGLYLCALLVPLAQWAGYHGGPQAACVGVAAALAVLLGMATARVPATAGLTAIAVAAAAAAGGASLASPPARDHVAAVVEGGVRSPVRERVVGVIVAHQDRGPDSVRITLEVERVGPADAERLSRGLVAVTIRHARERWQVGDRIGLRATLRRIVNFGNPGELDWAARNARRGLYVSAYLWSDEGIERLGTRSSLVTRIAAFRRRLVEGLRGYASPGAALVAALAVGERGLLDRGVTESIRDAGLAHVLAISGLHLGMVVGVAFWLASCGVLASGLGASGRDPVRPALAAAAVALAGYMAIAGASVSALRAATMSAVAIAASWRGRRVLSLRGLAAASLLLSLLWPGVAEEPGFQLSFTAVAALLSYAGTRLRSPRPQRRARRVWGWVIEATAASLIAWLSTAALAAHHFGRLSLVAPVANLAVALPVAGTLLAALAGVSLSLVSRTAAGICLTAAVACADVVVWLAARLAALPGAGLVVPEPSWPLTTCLSAIPFCVALPRGRRALAVSVLVALAAGLSAVAVHARYRDDRLDVVFVSVGQGDATVVRLPGGKVMVVDGGPPGVGRIALAPLLARMAIGRIDYMVVTHVQSDHWSGLAELLDRVVVGELWSPGGHCASPGFLAFRQRLARTGTRQIEIGSVLEACAHGPRQAVACSLGSNGTGAGTRWSVELLWPARPPPACDDNDSSVVVRVRYGDRAVLLTGDLESDGERGLLARGLDLRATVLKVGHHGSATSSTSAFLRTIRPALAVASMGAGNRYGFPYPGVVERFERLGVPLYRTDRDGAVMVSVYADGGLEVRTARR